MTAHQHILLLITASATLNAYAASDNDQRVSLEQLVDRPMQYQGARVAVEATATIEFEGDRLCAGDSHDLRHCLWLNIVDRGATANDAFAAEQGWAPFHGKRVIVHGTFNSRDKGHRGLFAGAIGNVTRVEPLSQ